MVIYKLCNYEPNYSEANTIILEQYAGVFSKNPNSAHTHDYYEFILVEEGDAVHHINGKACVVGRGSLALIRCSDYHCFLNYKSDRYKMYNMRFSKEVFDIVNAYLSGAADELLKPELPVMATLTEDRLIWFGDTLREIKEMKVCKYRGIIVRNLITQVIMQLAAVKAPAAAMPAWLCEIVASLENEQDLENGFEGIIEKSSVSREHISRSFRKYLGVTPSQYMNVMRIRRAGQFIENGADDILWVSCECGFNNLGYFYKQFSNYFHMTPGEYRKKKQNKINF